MRAGFAGVAAASAVAVAVASVVVGMSTPGAQAAAGAIFFADPGSPTAGPVRLTGSVGVGPGETTTVLYVVDATDSTGSPVGADCSGDGAVSAADDLNGDGSVGDTLDCEIAGVSALNASLATAPGALQVGLVAFANEAAAADLEPAGSALFVPPGHTGGDSAPRVVQAATSVTRNQIARFDVRDLGGSGAGTAFNNAIATSLNILAQAPAGPKWVMFLSDGLAPLADSSLDSLRKSGIKWRSFAVGGQASCNPNWALAEMAAATGEGCVQVASPASLRAGLTGSRPDAVNAVTVEINGVSVGATLDAIGSWTAQFTLGEGIYTATVRAVLASGATVTAQRTFTVGPALAGTTAPPPGSVTVGPGAANGTMVKVVRPRPTRTYLPSRVTGRVGRPGTRLIITPKLAGSTVLLQARTSTGAPWVTVDRDRVDRDGRYLLSWDRQPGMRFLRVVLKAYRGFAGSAAAVPAPKISACKIIRSSGWTITCRTTAPTGSRVRLLNAGTTVDRAAVRDQSLTVHGKGQVSQHTIEITVNTRRHIRLEL